MKNFERLSRAEMKSVLGGDTPLPINGKIAYNCQCTGTAGTWVGHYSSQAFADQDTANNCRNGGTCTPA